MLAPEHADVSQANGLVSADALLVLLRADVVSV